MKDIPFLIGLFIFQKIYYNKQEVMNMEKHRAIPQGYMTVGEIAKEMGVTPRTLQYYDKRGVLSPSSISEGGYRLVLS